MTHHLTGDQPTESDQLIDTFPKLRFRPVPLGFGYGPLMAPPNHDDDGRPGIASITVVGRHYPRVTFSRQGGAA